MKQELDPFFLFINKTSREWTYRNLWQHDLGKTSAVFCLLNYNIGNQSFSNTIENVAP